MENQPGVQRYVSRRTDREGVIGSGAVVHQRVALGGAVGAAVHRQDRVTPEILVAEREQAVDLESPGLIVGTRSVHNDVIIISALDREAAIASLPIVAQDLDAV